MRSIKKGSVDITLYMMMVDAVTAAPETALVITDFDLQYTRNRGAPATKVDAVALASTDAAHTDNRAIEIDATHSPGLYRIDWPDAAFATGADQVVLVVTCAGCYPAIREIDLLDHVEEDTYSLVGTVPTAAQNADALLDRNMATGADSGSSTVRTVRQALRFLRNKRGITGTELTVMKEDDTTSSWVAEVTATPGVDPITDIDPAG